jgi:hypothetical protein
MADLTHIVYDQDGILIRAEINKSFDKVNTLVGLQTTECNIAYFGAKTGGFDNTDIIQGIADELDGVGGVILIPAGEYSHTGLVLPTNVGIRGVGWGSILLNTGTECSILYKGEGTTTESTDRVTGQMIRDVYLKGNASSLDGIAIELAGTTDDGVDDRDPSVAYIDHVKITHHGKSAVRIGTSTTLGAGNKFSINNSMLSYNEEHGVYVLGQSNVVNVSNNVISNNTLDGVRMNHVTSTCTTEKNQIMDNQRFGFFGTGVEQPIILSNVFNRNQSGALFLTGSTSKYTEAAAICYNLFGDNGQGVTNQREVQLNHIKGSSLFLNYFYGAGQVDMVYLNDNTENLLITENYFKDITTENKVTVAVGAVNVTYVFEDRGA